MSGTHDLNPPGPGDQPEDLLTFDVLDDLADLAEGERAGEVAGTAVRRIGPLVEYAYHDYLNARRTLKVWSRSAEAAALGETLWPPGALAVPANTSLSPGDVEFIRPPRSEADADRGDWLAFRKRFENAAVRVGVEHGFAKALSGTMWEMTDNVIFHSEAPQTAVVGYRISDGEFEYVVADAGVGVYDSLKKHLDYADLKDSTEALRVATKAGESRFGRGSGHGFGFRQLLENIAKRDSSLRFRSGDASLNVEGSLDRVSYTTRQGTFFKGFLVSAVTRPPVQTPMA